MMNKSYKLVFQGDKESKQINTTIHYLNMLNGGEEVS
jgi:hypothetical protein